MGELIEQIRIVARTRRELQETTVIRNTARDEWEKQNKEILDAVTASAVVASEAEIKLRELTLQAFAETGSKSPASGVGIRIKTILNYLSSDAMDWAMEHKLALKLDSSAFEKIAKTNNLPFVTISEEPQATIATNLEEIDLWES